jgi:hypothetical protein
MPLHGPFQQRCGFVDVLLQRLRDPSNISDVNLDSNAFRHSHRTYIRGPNVTRVLMRSLAKAHEKRNVITDNFLSR